jgi:hypothetical protein
MWLECSSLCCILSTCGDCWLACRCRCRSLVVRQRVFLPSSSGMSQESASYAAFSAETWVGTENNSILGSTARRCGSLCTALCTCAIRRRSRHQRDRLCRPHATALGCRVRAGLQSSLTTGVSELTWHDRAGGVRTVQALVALGARIDAESANLVTPLHCAAASGRRGMCFSRRVCVCVWVGV